ncbi:MAG: aldo/keto reductase [Magnetococcales bacterium]|nr:aldo/keto reductase [Magnetococcales bacterium]
MEYRAFGRTGLELSAFTIGGMRFPHGWDEPHDHLPEDSLTVTARVVEEGLTAGCNLIETAQGYGKSERLLGQVLPHLPSPLRGRYHLMTKGRPRGTGDQFRRNLEESLGHLGVDRVALFAIHGINTEAEYRATFERGGCLEAALRARDQGLVGHVGFSSHAPLDLLLRTLASGAFEFVDLHYYYFRTGNAPALALARALGMGVFIISPNDKGGRLYDPPDQLRRLTRPLHPVNFNERWLLAHPEIHTLSLGLSAPGQMAIHLDSLAPRPWWGPAERQAEARLRAAVADPLRADCGTRCRRCLPCPERIDIPELMRLRHLAESYGMLPFARYRYGEMQPDDAWVPGARGDSCTRCGDCRPRCPAGFDLPALMHQSHRLFHNP